MAVEQEASDDERYADKIPPRATGFYTALTACGFSYLCQATVRGSYAVG